MVGVPKSNRCTFCKKRKTKCDEKWPTCGACARAKVVCSGARNKFKFVVNGCHNESATTASPYPAPHPATIATTSSILTSAPTFAVTAPTLLAGDHSGNYRSDKTMAGRVRSINTTANKKTAKKQGHRHHLANAVVDMHEHSKGGCCTLQRMRLPPSSTFSPYAPYTRTITSTRALAPFCPFPSAGVPMSAAALLAARFVRCLDAAPCTGNDLQLMGSALRMIPQQLILGGSSPSPSTNHIHTSSRSGREKREISGGMGSVVLHHVVELVVASWSNSRRGLPPSSWLDLKAYGSALRSLQGAVTAQMDGLGLTHTLAALALLQKVEIVYDFERGSNCENHTDGLIAVVSKGGPWQGFTEFSLHLMFDSYYYMLQQDIRLGRQSEFISHDWITAFEQAIDMSTIRPILKSMYHLWVKMTHWPTLVALVRYLCLYPCERPTAAELSQLVMSLANYLHNEDATIIAALKEFGDITEVKNTICPDLFPTCYEFSDYDTAKYFTFHAFFGIICYRAQQQANQVLGQDDPSLEKQCRELSKRIWMSHGWMKTQRPLAVDFTGPLAFSYESGNSAEKRFCIESLEDMEYFRTPPPIGRWIDATIMANVKGYSGRVPFVTTRDISVELQGIGCRYGRTSTIGAGEGKVDNKFNQTF